MTWDYAELSKAAKAFGGPEKLVEHIVDVSKKSGRIEMIPVAVGSGVGFFIIGVAVDKAVNYFKAKKDASQKELEATKAELIKGIKDYDTKHPEVVVSETPDSEATCQSETNING